MYDIGFFFVHFVFIEGKKLIKRLNEPVLWFDIKYDKVFFSHLKQELFSFLKEFDVNKQHRRYMCRKEDTNTHTNNPKKQKPKKFLEHDCFRKEVKKRDKQRFRSGIQEFKHRSFSAV